MTRRRYASEDDYHDDMEAFERSLSDWCRCNCPTTDHVVEWSGDGWNEPRGYERRCDGPCNDACTSGDDRTRCDDCGTWRDREDMVLVRQPCEGVVCLACANMETKEAKP